MADRPRRTKGGRQSLGERVQTSVYLPVDLRDAMEELADRDHLSMNSVMVRLLAERLELIPPPYCYPKTDDDSQGELPLTRAS